MTTDLNTAEKIETIVNSYLRSQVRSGSMGDIVSVDNGWMAIRVDGVFVRVARGPITWNVSMPSKGLIGSDQDLCAAAALVLEAA